MGKPGATGLTRIWNAMFYSLDGLRAALRYESAFRQECVLAVIMIPLAFWFGQTPVERTLLIGSVILVLIVELLNSAVEAVVDRVGTDQHDLSGRAKDLGSAAVFMSLGLVVYVWIEILLKPF